MTDRERNTEQLKPNWDVGIPQNEPVGWLLFLAGIVLLCLNIIRTGFQAESPESAAGMNGFVKLLLAWSGPLLIIAGAVFSEQVNRAIPFHGLRAGMWVTTLNLFRNLNPLNREKFCLQYPDDPNAARPLWFGPRDATRRNTYLDRPDTRFRGHHVQMRNPETGELFCIICNQCANICPNDIITIESEMEEVEIDGKTRKKRKLTKFEVDLSKCFFCGLCQDVCPEPAIRLSGGYEYGDYQRNRLVANLDNMIRDMPLDEYEEYKRQKEEEQRQKELARKQKAEEAERAKAEREAAEKPKSHLAEPPRGDDSNDKTENDSDARGRED